MHHMLRATGVPGSVVLRYARDRSYDHRGTASCSQAPLQKVRWNIARPKLASSSKGDRNFDETTLMEQEATP